MEYLELFKLIFLLFCGHAVGDFALQNEFVATNKNRHVRDRFTPDQLSKMEVIWPWLLSAHAMHHGIIVYLITQNFWICFLETLFHALIDYGKCERWYNFHADQYLHLLNKIIWAVMIYYQVL